MTEWDERQLCPDGGCVGLIGPDGTCKVCGRVAPGWGDERQRGLLPPTDSGDGSDAVDGGDAADAAADEPAPDDEASAPPAEAEAGDEWTDRRLCSNGACVGVIGADGH